MNDRSTTIMVSEDGKSAVVCNYNIAKYKSLGWEISKDQSTPHPVIEEPVGTPADKPDESSDDAEPTPEDKKKIDELIAGAETEQIIEPESKPEQPDVPPEISSEEAKKLAEAHQNSEPKPVQPKAPKPEDDVVMPA